MVWYGPQIFTPPFFIASVYHPRRNFTIKSVGLFHSHADTS